MSKELTRGRDDAELEELADVLARYRRTGGAWERVEIDGREAYSRKLDCGHVEIVFGALPPRGAVVVHPDGTEVEMPLSTVCRTCYGARGDA